MALTKVPSNLDSVTATTQSQGDGSTNVATTAYVDTGLANLIDSAPSNLNTLNELAAAMNDNASFFSTVLPLSGGTMTGNIAHAGDFTLDVGGDITFDAGGGDILFKDDGTLVGTIGGFAGNNVTIKSEVSDGDVIIQGNDGGSSITALTLDMSDAGSAYFNNDVYVDKYFRLRTTDDQANSWLLYTNTNDNFEINYNGAGNAEVVVDTSGKVGIGTTSPGGTLDVHTSSTGITVEHDGNNHFNHVGEFFAPNTSANRNALFAVGKSGSSKNTGYLGYYWTASGSDNNFAHISHWASDYLFRVYGQGNYYFAGSSISDRDLKENIVDIPEPSLDKVKQLRVRKFNMIPLGDDDVTPTKVGFIAQEVQEAMPNVVTGTDGNKDMAVDTTGVVGHLVKAVQELSEKLDAAEARITELEE